MTGLSTGSQGSGIRAGSRPNQGSGVSSGGPPPDPPITFGVNMAFGLHAHVAAPPPGPSGPFAVGEFEMPGYFQFEFLTAGGLVVMNDSEAMYGSSEVVVQTAQLDDVDDPVFVAHTVMSLTEPSFSVNYVGMIGNAVLLAIGQGADAGTFVQTLVAYDLDYDTIVDTFTFPTTGWWVGYDGWMMDPATGVLYAYYGDPTQASDGMFYAFDVSEPTDISVLDTLELGFSPQPDAMNIRRPTDDHLYVMDPYGTAFTAVVTISNPSNLVQMDMIEGVPNFSQVAARGDGYAIVYDEAFLQTLDVTDVTAPTVVSLAELDVGGTPVSVSEFSPGVPARQAPWMQVEGEFVTRGPYTIDVSTEGAREDLVTDLIPNADTVWVGWYTGSQIVYFKEGESVWLGVTNDVPLIWAVPEVEIDYTDPLEPIMVVTIPAGEWELEYDIDYAGPTPVDGSPFTGPTTVPVTVTEMGVEWCVRMRAVGTPWWGYYCFLPEAPPEPPPPTVTVPGSGENGIVVTWPETGPIEVEEEVDGGGYAPVPGSPIEGGEYVIPIIDAPEGEVHCFRTRYPGGEWSDPVCVTAGPPAPPTWLSVVAGNWSAQMIQAVVNPETGIEEWYFEVQIDGGAWTDDTAHQHPAGYAVFYSDPEELVRGSTYCFRAKQSNVYGQSEFSDESCVTMNPEYPLSAPYLLYDARHWNGRMSPATSVLPNLGSAGSDWDLTEFFDPLPDETNFVSGFIGTVADADWADLGGPPCDGPFTLMIWNGDAIFTQPQTDYAAEFTWADGRISARGYSESFSPNLTAVMEMVIGTLSTPSRGAGGSYTHVEHPDNSLRFATVDMLNAAQANWASAGSISPLEVPIVDLCSVAEPLGTVEMQFSGMGYAILNGASAPGAGWPWRTMSGFALFRGIPTQDDIDEWEAYFADDPPVGAVPFAYEGGERWYDDEYCYHTFTTFDDDLEPIVGATLPTTIDFRLVGGGGDSVDGSSNRGGGAGGAVIDVAAHPAPSTTSPYVAGQGQSSGGGARSPATFEGYSMQGGERSQGKDGGDSGSGELGGVGSAGTGYPRGGGGGAFGPGGDSSGPLNSDDGGDGGIGESTIWTQDGVLRYDGSGGPGIGGFNGGTDGAGQLPRGRGTGGSQIGGWNGSTGTGAGLVVRYPRSDV